MHYRDGKPAKAGDLVLSDELNQQVIGILTGAQSQSSTCNGTINPLARRVKSELGIGPWQTVTAPGDYYVTLPLCIQLGDGIPPPTEGPH